MICVVINFITQIFYTGGGIFWHIHEKEATIEVMVAILKVMEVHHERENQKKVFNSRKKSLRTWFRTTNY